MNKFLNIRYIKNIEQFSVGSVYECIINPTPGTFWTLFDLAKNQEKRMYTNFVFLLLNIQRLRFGVITVLILVDEVVYITDITSQNLSLFELVC